MFFRKKPKEELKEDTTSIPQKREIQIKNVIEYEVGYPVLNTGKKFYPVYKHTRKEFTSDEDKLYYMDYCIAYNTEIYDRVVNRRYMLVEYFTVKKSAEKFCKDNTTETETTITI